MLNKYYIYILLDSSKPGNYTYGNYKLDYEPFYVGKGTYNRIKNTIYDKSPFKKNKIDKLKKNNIDIISIKLIENLSNSESILKEIEIINLIGRRDLGKGTLVNLTDGGDGRRGSKHSKEVRLKISLNRKGKGCGWKHIPETIKCMSKNQSGEKNGFFGKKHSDIFKSNQSERISGLKHHMYGKKHSKESIYKMKKYRLNLSNSELKHYCESFNKSLDMLSLDLEYIRSFKSVKEASYETGISESTISKCCRGDIIRPSRYFFRYINDFDKIKNNKFLINIGDLFEYNGYEYILIKRNKKTAICLNSNYEEVTIKYKDCKLLQTKEINDSDLVEIYIFLNNIDKSFKIDRNKNLIYNIYYKIYYNKYSVKIDDIISRYNDEYEVINIFPDMWNRNKDLLKYKLKNIITF